MAEAAGDGNNEILGVSWSRVFAPLKIKSRRRPIYLQN